LPLFPGFVFVHFDLQQRLRILGLPGVVRLVSFNGQPAMLPEHDIDTLRKGLDLQIYAEPHPYLRVGRRVRVMHGPMAGTEGILVRKKEKFRLVISLEAIMLPLPWKLTPPTYSRPDTRRFSVFPNPDK
jgi:transcription antitermination factor NusG